MPSLLGVDWGQETEEVIVRELEMNLSYRILNFLNCKIFEGVSEGSAEDCSFTLFKLVRRQVNRGSSGTTALLLPILYSISPKVPNLWCAGGDLEPMVVNMEKVVRSPQTGGNALSRTVNDFAPE